MGESEKGTFKQALNGGTKYFGTLFYVIRGTYNIGKANVSFSIRPFFV